MFESFRHASYDNYFNITRYLLLSFNILFVFHNNLIKFKYSIAIHYWFEYSATNVSRLL